MNDVWFHLGLSLSWLIQPVFLLALYFLVFAPFGVFLKLFRREKNVGQWVIKKKQCQLDKTF